MSKGLRVTCKKDILLKMNNLNKNEQKLLFLILSHIDPIKDTIDNQKTKIIKISKSFIKESLNIKSNRFYSDILNITAGLNTKLIFEAKKDKNEEGFFHGTWIATAENKLYDSYIEFEITPKMLIYFVDLKPPFITLDIDNILCLDSIYSIGLYTLIRSDLYKQDKYNRTIKYPVDFFNPLFSLNYKYKHLKIFVFKKAINEINEKTDLNISINEIKNGGRKVVELEFIVYIQERKDINNKDAKIIIKAPIDSSKYRAKLGDGHHLLFDKLVSNGITEKKAYELITSDEISNDIISPNIDLANHLINNGYPAKSKTGFILDAIRKNYVGSARAGKNRLRQVSKNAEEIERQKELEEQNKRQKEREKCNIWWENLSEEQKNKYLEDNKIGNEFHDKENIIRSRIFIKYINNEIK